jgi:hypothetical protein
MDMPVYTDLDELVSETEILLKSIDCRV